MVSKFLIIFAFGLVLLIFVVRWVIGRGRGQKERIPSTLSVLILGLTVLFCGAYVRFAAEKYESLLGRFDGVSSTKNEAEYFAVQTMTTVGYGGALAAAEANAPSELRSEFHGLAKWLMLPGVMFWALCIWAVTNLILQTRQASSMSA